MSIQPYVHVETFEEYKERFKDYAYMERTDDGILLVKLQWKGGPLLWSYQSQHAYGELWTAIGHDKQNQVMILTGTDPYWGVHESDPTSFEEVEQSTDAEFLKYNCNCPDTMNFVENFINDIEIPTIACINGMGWHYEFALMSDITLCVPDFFFSDIHFTRNMVCGDGMSFSMRHAAGFKRANYMMYVEPKITAQQAYDWGIVNELIPHDKLLERAYELAGKIMEASRPVRLLTHGIAIRPWKQALQDEEQFRVLSEMYSCALLKSEHHFEIIADLYDNK